MAHFLTSVARMWDDVVRSCAHQRVFCGVDCVDGWLAREELARGYVMDLGTLWRLARGVHRAAGSGPCAPGSG
ncbi:hypothetical protein GCM10009560_43910 [Nonomuraea longicatena]|uniref:Uncharacterized protein n=1 Tax=Nonomuraea longicatena TaxID=83682 RepID=A0ABN1Q0M2_9ACTN